jgi:hypothetical protein
VEPFLADNRHELGGCRGERVRASIDTDPDRRCGVLLAGGGWVRKTSSSAPDGGLAVARSRQVDIGQSVKLID